jgi:tRNA A37 N6-isopentenylltransferase MiaA
MTLRKNLTSIRSILLLEGTLRHYRSFQISSSSFPFKDILNRGKVPIITGGTGFYIKWLIYGPEGPPISTPLEIRKKIDKQIELEGFDKWYMMI